MSQREAQEPEAVAVVGMAGRFPGAASVEELWQNQLAGVSSISVVTAEELAAAGLAELGERPEYVPARGVVDDPEWFDAEFFGLSPREAELMDPQIRLFLECAWQAAERAGRDIRAFAGRAGVYAGAGASSYLAAQPLDRPGLDPLLVRLGNSGDFLAAWVAYKLDLRGPSVTVQTACSTALASVYFAVQGLLDGDCDLAFAGGVALAFPQRCGYLYQEGGVLSPDGRCRAFDAEARGTVPGGGVGVVVLRRLSDALADGDPIQAVLRGVALNNDGAGRAGFTAPGVEGQMKVVAEALSLSGVPVETVRYVEAHGSGTPLGDPIEVEALTRAFRHFTPARGFCALGSVKTAVGHLDSAAGVAGLVRAVCAVRDGKLPPSLHFSRPNPKIDFAASPFYVNTEARDWPADGASRPPRRAGVSSLGIGGTNVHAVVEEPPVVPSGPSRPWQQLHLSARSEAALAAAGASLLDHLRRLPADAAALADVAYTLKVGRHPFRHRLAVVCRDRDEAVAALAGEPPGRLWRDDAAAGGQERAGVAFLLPGLGDLYPGMAGELYRSEPAFRDAVDRCAALLAPRLGIDLRTVLYPPEAQAAAVDAGRDLRRLLRLDPAPPGDGERRLAETWLAQPAVFTVEYALAQLLQEWGIRPQALLGYSVGELVAAYLAGVLSLDDALDLVAERALAVHALPAGALLAVPLPAAETREHLAALGSHGSESPGGAGDLELAAVNGPSLSVVGGPEGAVAALAGRLAAAGVACLPVRTTHAFHTAAMAPARQAVARAVAGKELSPPQIPFLSNVTGTWITAEEATDPEYWGRHLVSPVRFADGLAELLGRPELVLLEVGPGQMMATLARQQEARGAGSRVVSLLPGRDAGLAEALAALSQLWLAGIAPDWAGFYRREERRRLPLPTYPFERRRFWIEAPARPLAAVAAPAPSPEGKPPRLDDWFHVQGWQRRAPLPERTAPPAPIAEGPWLVFLDPDGFGAELGQAVVEALERAGRRVERVVAGAGFAAPGGAGQPYAVDPGRREDYGALLAELGRRGALPRRILHLWSAAPAAAAGLIADGGAAELAARCPDLLARGYYSLLFLAQALGEIALPEPVGIGAVSTEVQEVTGGEALCPPKAAVLGACRVISQEYPDLWCRSLDVEPGGALSPAALADRLVAELADAGGPPVVAWRGRHPWCPTVERLAVGPAPRPAPRLLPGGVYLLTGGLEESGLALAEHLARTAAARLVLVVPPDGADGSEGAGGSNGAGGEAARRLAALEGLAAGLLVLPADAGDPGALAAAVVAARRHFGALHGVVHNAGLPATGLIQLKTAAASRAVLAPKIAGSLALAAALEDVDGPEPPFLVLFSSTAGWLGGVGQADAAAAGAFLEALARQRAGRRGWTTALAWDPFRWQANALPSGAGVVPDLLRQAAESQATFAIDAGEMTEAFDRALAAGLPQVAISCRRLDAVLAELDGLAGGSLLDLTAPAAVRHPRPELPVPYRAPTTATEEALLELWRDAFGYDLGVDDDFFALDGSSLLAIQLVTRLRQACGVDLPLGALFELPTVARLGAHIDELRAAGRGDLDEIAALLAEIEGLSEESAERLLEIERGAT